MPSAKEAKAQMIIAWNGKDIGVTHAVRNGENLRIVSDFKNHRAILFMDAHKIASPVPLSAEFTEIYDVQTYKNKATKTLATIPADYETYIPKSTKTNEKTPNK